NQTITRFQDKLMAVAPFPNENKPYYFSNPYKTGNDITSKVTMGTAFGGAAAPPKPSDNPWGTAHGPYWELLCPDLVSFKPEAPPPGSTNFGMQIQQGPNMMGELPFSIDLFATRQTNPPTYKKSMNGYYSFTFRYKVHIKEDIK